MASRLLEKAEKLELDTLANLELRSVQVHDSLQGERALLNERVVNGHIQKLEEAVTVYEESISGIFAAAGDDTEKKKLFSDKLSDQMTKVNPLLDELYLIQKTNKAATEPTVPSQSSKLLKTIQLKVRLAQKSIESRLTLVQEAEKEETTRGSLTKVQANLDQLDEVQALAQRELDAICKQVVSGELKEADVVTLQQETEALIDHCTQSVSILKAKLKEAAAELKGSEVIQLDPPPSLTTDLSAQIAKEIATLKVGLDNKSSSKNVADFGFSKIAVPEFKGDVKEYTKWRGQVEDYLTETAKKSTEKQAVQFLDRLTPKEIDVSRCATLAEAWIKLTGEYGSPVFIARLLLKDFNNFSPSKASDESKLVQLRNTLSKLESDLTINGEEARCNDFSVLDHAESLLPGRFRDQYVEVKDDLIQKKGSSFAALTFFLKEKATLVQTHLADRLMDSSNESKKLKELEARLAKYEAEISQEKDLVMKDKDPDSEDQE